MNKQRGFTAIELIIVIVVLFMAIGWVKNIIKLSNCDFAAPYKAEVIHGVGIIPIVGGITGWLNVGV